MLSSHISYLTHKLRDMTNNPKKTKAYVDGVRQLRNLISNHELRIIQIDGVVSEHILYVVIVFVLILFANVHLSHQIYGTHSLKIWSESTTNTIKILTNTISVEMMEKIQLDLEDNMENLSEAMDIMHNPTEMDDEEFYAQYAEIGGELCASDPYLGCEDLPSAPNDPIRSTVDRCVDLDRSIDTNIGYKILPV